MTKMHPRVSNGKTASTWALDTRELEGARAPKPREYESAVDKEILRLQIPVFF